MIKIHDVHTGKTEKVSLVDAKKFMRSKIGMGYKIDHMTVKEIVIRLEIARKIRKVCFAGANRTDREMNQLISATTEAALAQVAASDNGKEDLVSVLVSSRADEVKSRRRPSARLGK